MELVFRAAIDALDDLRAPGMVKLFFACLGLTTLAAVLMLAIGIGVTEVWLEPMLPTASEVSNGVLFALMKLFFWSMVMAAFIVPIFIIFWSLMIFIASFFDEYIAEKIEQFRYPQLPVGQSRPFWQEFRHDLLFSLKILSANMLLILIPIFWPLWPILFPLMNGHMLGRYFFRMAGRRHLGKTEADALARKHWGKVTLAGLCIVIASGIPILQLIVPFWGVAMMVHLYHLVAPAAEAHPQI